MQKALISLISSNSVKALSTAVALTLVLLMFATGYGCTPIAHLRPNVTYENVSSPAGKLSVYTHGNGDTSYIKPNELLDRWAPGRGLLVMANDFLCGQEVTVRRSTGESAFGRLIVYEALSGSGPAGRGDYLVKIGDDAIDAAKQGRKSVRYELYNHAYGGERYAWILFVSDTPLPCTGEDGPHAAVE